MGRGNIASRESDAGSATDAATAYKHALKLCGEGAYGKALTVSVCSSPISSLMCSSPRRPVIIEHVLKGCEHQPARCRKSVLLLHFLFLRCDNTALDTDSTVVARRLANS